MGSAGEIMVRMIGWLPVALLSIALVAPLALRPAAAADVNQTLVAASFQFHLGTASGTSPPAVTVTAGDTLRLRIENVDTTTPRHTFTLSHFSVDLTLADGSASVPSVAFVNITTTATDVGTWQFHCLPHSTGAEGSRTGMIGSIVVQAAAKPTPGFEFVAVVAAIGAALVVVRVARRRP